MGAKDLVNGAVDSMLATINLNLTLLGLGGVEERAEDPAVMDKVRDNGSWAYLVPLAEGRDRMRFAMGGTKDMVHDFSVNVTGYYIDNTSPDLPTGLRICRNHAYDLIDLLNGDDAVISQGVIYAAELEMGYILSIDKVVHVFNVKFAVKILED
jgi:hypothetical protein